jgi:hypothetical protein
MKRKSITGMQAHRKKYSNNKDINDKVKELIKSKWLFRPGKKHNFLIPPNGGKLSIPSTPSCRHSFNNFCRDINHIETGFYL